jgi:hypothetical protein
MQASLKDLAPTGHHSQSFVICQRVLHKCHEIIFGDLPPSASGPYSNLCLPFQSRFARCKVRPHVEPALVGLGIVLASASAMPQLTEIMGKVAIEQGRMEDNDDEFKSVETQNEEVVRGITRATEPSTSDEDEDDYTPDGISSHSVESKMPWQGLSEPNDKYVGSPDHLPRHRTVGAAQTTPALHFHLNIRRSSLSNDPLGQHDPPSPVQSTSPYQSSPLISTSKHPERSGSQNPSETRLQQYDLPSQMHLLRSHYCRSEVFFSLFGSMEALNLNPNRFNSCLVLKTYQIDS